jgi:hypothetical protein
MKTTSNLSLPPAELSRALKEAGGRNCFVNQENLSRDKASITTGLQTRPSFLPYGDFSLALQESF